MRVLQRTQPTIMTRSAPYLQRRGLGFSFRIAVPPDLRSAVGLSEITRGLSGATRAQAMVLALQCAAQVKRTFAAIRESIEMPKSKDTGLTADFIMKFDWHPSGKPKSVEVVGEPHEKELVAAAVKAAIYPDQESPLATRAATISPPTDSTPRLPLPTLKELVAVFLENYKHDNHDAMLRKHQAVLPLLVEVLGDVPVSDLKQTDIKSFFAMVSKLPPKWKAECNRRKCSVKELSRIEFDKTIAPKTFRDSHLASVRAFLSDCQLNYGDRGFPERLTARGIKYQGNREEKEHTQRAFRAVELKALFESEQMRTFAAEKDLAHQFWLPHLGLFTGARANEICQINPQVDFIQDEESGIHYLWITELTDGDDRIKKSTKNDTSKRKVPIHSKLIDLGFLQYAGDMRASGATLLFPAWAPSRNRASPLPEKWFRQFLKDLNLRDETPKAMLVGMHAFRHTMLTSARNCRPDKIDITPITGHVGQDSAVVRGYQGELTLDNLRDLIEKIEFPVNFTRPVAR